jgi:xylan 1,4-beta-xylosidase
MAKIRNPILPGFHPDPSIIRVGDDYYIATSTFEWFPGVVIHHSKDLVHWRAIARPLNRIEQLDLNGVPCSGGVWAPCLSYNKGIFYLCYSIARTISGIFKDVHNYLVTTEDICGEWSNPTYLNSSGFDPSMFHDEDGSKYVMNVQWDFRKGRKRFNGIILQEFSAQLGKLIDKPIQIFEGSPLGITEGPHLMKREGLYYLITAEGGTDIRHAVTVARSTSLRGPYEIDPKNPMLTSYSDPTLPIQKAGHAQFVETQTGEWYLAHLGVRPIPSRGRSTLGRETYIQRMHWTPDGWPRLAEGGNRPLVEVTAPSLPPHSFESVVDRDDFDEELLPIQYQSLRIPMTEDIASLRARRGYLRLHGHESLSSRFTQALVAKRQTSFLYQAETCVEFEPKMYQQMAGLVCLHDVDNFYYLRISHDQQYGKCLSILCCQNGTFNYPLEQEISLQGDERCYLRVVVRYDQLQFYYSIDGEEWSKVGPIQDASTLSDEYSQISNYTGAFVGLCCQDLAGGGAFADFDYFEYIELQS